jgi:hypothetical protein
MLEKLYNNIDMELKFKAHHKFIKLLNIKFQIKNKMVNIKKNLVSIKNI